MSKICNKSCTASLECGVEKSLLVKQFDLKDNSNANSMPNMSVERHYPLRTRGSKKTLPV